MLELNEVARSLLFFPPIRLSAAVPAPKLVALLQALLCTGHEGLRSSDSIQGLLSHLVAAVADGTARSTAAAAVQGNSRGSARMMGLHDTALRQDDGLANSAASPSASSSLHAAVALGLYLHRCITRRKFAWGGGGTGSAGEQCAIKAMQRLEAEIASYLATPKPEVDRMRLPVMAAYSQMQETIDKLGLSDDRHGENEVGVDRHEHEASFPLNNFLSRPQGLWIPAADQLLNTTIKSHNPPTSGDHPSIKRQIAASALVAMVLRAKPSTVSALLQRALADDAAALDDLAQLAAGLALHLRSASSRPRPEEDDRMRQLSALGGCERGRGIIWEAAALSDGGRDLRAPMLVEALERLGASESPEGTDQTTAVPMSIDLDLVRSLARLCRSLPSSADDKALEVRAAVGRAVSRSAIRAVEGDLLRKRGGQSLLQGGIIRLDLLGVALLQPGGSGSFTSPPHLDKPAVASSFTGSVNLLSGDCMIEARQLREEVALSMDQRLSINFSFVSAQTLSAFEPFLSALASDKAVSMPWDEQQALRGLLRTVSQTIIGVVKEKSMAREEWNALLSASQMAILSYQFARQERRSTC